MGEDHDGPATRRRRSNRSSGDREQHGHDLGIGGDGERVEARDVVVAVGRCQGELAGRSVASRPGRDQRRLVQRHGGEGRVGRSGQIVGALEAADVDVGVAAGEVRAGQVCDRADHRGEGSDVDHRRRERARVRIDPAGSEGGAGPGDDRGFLAVRDRDDGAKAGTDGLGREGERANGKGGVIPCVRVRKELGPYEPLETHQARVRRGRIERRGLGRQRVGDIPRHAHTVRVEDRVGENHHVHAVLEGAGGRVDPTRGQRGEGLNLDRRVPELGEHGDREVGPSQLIGHTRDRTADGRGDRIDKGRHLEQPDASSGHEGRAADGAGEVHQDGRHRRSAVHRAEAEEGLGDRKRVTVLIQGRRNVDRSVDGAAEEQVVRDRDGAARRVIGGDGLRSRVVHVHTPGDERRESKEQNRGSPQLRGGASDRVCHVREVEMGGRCRGRPGRIRGLGRPERGAQSLARGDPSSRCVGGTWHLGQPGGWRGAGGRYSRSTCTLLAPKSFWPAPSAP